MGQTASQIERHIEEQRRELGRNVAQLEDRVRNAFSWRAQFQERPGTIIGAAFVGGLLLSKLFGHRSEVARRDAAWPYSA
ncbi:MAG: DUF3618 domain-containing protein [Acidobacteria bacterium]|nr:DUF3618 domain-containing protein [Acidobacteriota bacterium]